MHRYTGTTIVKDSFFANPFAVMQLADRLDYSNNQAYPGQRTENLFASQDKEVIEFGKHFAKRIADEIFYGLKKFEIDIRFHKNDVYDVEEANIGWIHNDDSNLAGLVYLNPEPSSMITGTSIFEKKDPAEFETQDYVSRTHLNLTKEVTGQYLKDLQNNHEQFEETLNVGNVFNRLVAYDSNMWHRPNDYRVSNLPRLSLLFFIKVTDSENPMSLLSLQSEWIDE
tara:strand:- start:11109 stop:11786 length:678 start_codon:yes stop_codon:yes gene_type:complete